jgi:hypothetical protein
VLNIKSTGAHRVKVFGGSGGSGATISSLFEEVPVEKRNAGSGWKLSPGTLRSPNVMFGL